MPAREFGFSQYCTPMWSFEQDLLHFRQCGASCLELSEAKLRQDRLDEQMALLGESGLRVSTVQPAVESFFEVKLSATLGNLEANRESLYRTVNFMGRTRVCDRFNTISGVLPGLTWSEALPTVALEYRELCKCAAQYGINVMIEPLHPLYCGLDSMISSLDEAAQLIDEVNLENLGITFDVWHLWQQPTIYNDIQKYKDRIWAVHISDWRPLRCAVDRHVPGEGEVPLGRLLGALEAVQYDNGYLVEFFSDWLLPDSLWRQDMVNVLRRCKEGFDKAWEPVNF